MRSGFNLENLSSSQKWVLVLSTILPPLGAFYAVVQQDHGFYSPLFLFYVPLSLAMVLLGINPTMLLAGVVFLFSALNLAAVSAPIWMTVAFGLGLLVNCYFWNRLIQANEIKEFGFRKSKDDVELAMNDAKLDHDKAKVAYQANLIKIQRYTALNELARSLAMTFKTQDVVVLLIETISKTFMVPGGITTLLLFDNSIGKSLHAVRYSVDTEMEARLNRERLNPQEPFNAWVVAQAKTLFSGDATNDFRFQNVSSEHKVGSIVSAPLDGGERDIGVDPHRKLFPGRLPAG